MLCCVLNNCKWLFSRCVPMHGLMACVSRLRGSSCFVSHFAAHTHEWLDAWVYRQRATLRRQPFNIYLIQFNRKCARGTWVRERARMNFYDNAAISGSISRSKSARRCNYPNSFSSPLSPFLSIRNARTGDLRRNGRIHTSAHFESHWIFTWIYSRQSGCYERAICAHLYRINSYSFIGSHQKDGKK